MLKHQGELIYGRFISEQGNTFWLRHFHHWHVQVDNDGWPVFPSPDPAKRRQQKSIIWHLRQRILYGHATLAEAVEIVSSCKHERMSIEEYGNLLGPITGQNYECPNCGLNFYLDYEMRPDDIDDYNWSLEQIWPKEVQEVAKKFAGLIFNGIEDLCFYRCVLIEEPSSMPNWPPFKHKKYYNRDGSLTVLSCSSAQQCAVFCTKKRRG